ncbi:hypothetical protein BDU57DRAFT_511532 [Ampelomyces quisqualis]|uniref:GPI anchored protein n=1 Tax=Ampelomyces quisqualis TaxID=50730 RepID=A0A6A5QSZ6_AMPQU|nr:hypothetical protein BDU57DRAFT_511532 [Ampelomyces quisqualis]
MHFQTLSTFSAILAVVAAQKVEQSDIPSQCNNVCADLVSTAQRCDRENNDNDPAELQCICTSQNANTLVPDCELCVRQNNRDNDNDDDNDVYDVLTSCSFQRAQQTSMASGSQSPTVVQTSISSGGTMVQTSVTVTPSAPVGSASALQNTGAAAPAQTGAALGLGALGLAALGLL